VAVEMMELRLRISETEPDLAQTADYKMADGRCRGSTLSTFGLVTISGCVPYAAVDVRRLSFPVTSAQSLPVFRSHLKTHLFRHSFPWLYCCAREVTLVIMDTLIVVLTFLLTYPQIPRLGASQG